MLTLESNSSWMLLAGVALMCIVLLRRWRRHYRRRPPAKFSGKPREQHPRRPPQDTPPEVLRWEVEMHETARDLKAELDSKILALQATIRLAHESAARLEAAADRAERLGVKAVDPYERLDALAAFEDPADAEPHRRTDGFPSPYRAAVMALAELGQSAEQIAESLEAPLGEVEMLLSLHQAASAAPRDDALQPGDSAQTAHRS